MDSEKDLSGIYELLVNINLLTVSVKIVSLHVYD